jgi:Neuraminidase (sialidase)
MTRREFVLATTALAYESGLRAAPEIIDRDGPTKLDLLPPGPGNPRNSEGSFLPLTDGRLLFVYTRFTGGAGDNATAALAARHSADGGHTWSDRDTIVVRHDEAGMNVMSASLVRLPAAIGLVYLRKNSRADCRPYLRVSKDEGATWGSPTLCCPAAGYFVVNNDRVVRLTSGRLVMPAARHAGDGDKWSARATAVCLLSDDGGGTWHQGRGEVEVPAPSKTGMQEPAVVERKDGSLMLFARTDQGCQMRSDSNDGGETWTAARPTAIKSPVSPCSVKRIPKTGDLLLVWNDHARIDPARRDRRTPLAVAISRDDGETWEKTKVIEDAPDGWFCYTAIAFVGDRGVLAYCAGDKQIGRLSRTRVTTFTLDWLYR